MTQLGIALTAAAIVMLAVGFVRAERRGTLPIHGWAGFLLLLVAECLLYLRVWPVDVYFTPIAWTAYLLIVDSMVLAISGRSRLHNSPARFFLTLLLSVPLWLVFEAYNLRLANWTYVGLPANRAAALLGYGWSFATITPAILETADLIEAFGWFRPTRPVRLSLSAERIICGVGAVCLIVPIVIPRHVAAYLFALVWIGFALLLDPINHWLRLPSLLDDLAQGHRCRLYSLILSGWTCGWLWEFWNYWAAAKWHYIFPIFQRAKIFEMPVPGYLGFLPFALECFVMWVTAISLLDAVWGWAMHDRESTKPPPLYSK